MGFKTILKGNKDSRYCRDVYNSGNIRFYKDQAKEIIYLRFNLIIVIKLAQEISITIVLF